MTSAQIIFFKNLNAMTAGRDGQLERSCSQIGKDRLEVWMHTVLAGSEIHRADRQAFHHCLRLIEGKAVGAGGVAITKGASEITFIGEPQTESNAAFSRNHARC